MWYRTAKDRSSQNLEARLLRHLAPSSGASTPNLHPEDESSYRMVDGYPTLGFWVLPNGTISDPLESHNWSADRALLKSGVPRVRPMAKDDLMSHANVVRLNTGVDHSYGEFRHAPTAEQLAVMERESLLMRGWGDFAYDVYHPDTGAGISSGTSFSELRDEPWGEHFDSPDKDTSVDD